MEKCYILKVQQQFADKEKTNAKYDDDYVNNYLKNNHFDGIGACPFEVTGYRKDASKDQKESGVTPLIAISKKANWTHSINCNSTPKVSVHRTTDHNCNPNQSYLHMNI